MELMEQVIKKGRGRPALPAKQRLTRNVSFWIREEDYKAASQLFPAERMSDVLRRGLQLVIEQVQAASQS